LVNKFTSTGVIKNNNIKKHYHYVDIDNLMVKLLNESYSGSINNRQYEYDNIRIFATFSVILIHVLGELFQDYPIQSFLQQKPFIVRLTITYEALFRSGIPLFLMLTGVLLMPRKELGYKFVRKRLIRILIPYIIWSSVYLAITGMNEYINLHTIITALIYGSNYHLWFVRYLLLVYLTIPFLKYFLVKFSLNGYYFVAFAVFIMLILNLSAIAFPYKNLLMFYVIFLGYVTMGYFLASYNHPLLNNLLLGIILTIVGSTITLFGGLGYIIATKYVSVDFYSIITFHIIVRSVGIYIIFKCLSKHVRLDIQLFLSRLSKYSFGIYLLHPLILLALQQCGVSYKLFSPVVGIPITALICISISAFIFFVIDRLPFGKYLY
jgi:surface polysaccharide O-acyltransferase-like enzyme